MAGGPARVGMDRAGRVPLPRPLGAPDARGAREDWVGADGAFGGVASSQRIARPFGPANGPPATQRDLNADQSHHPSNDRGAQGGRGPRRRRRVAAAHGRLAHDGDGAHGHQPGQLGRQRMGPGA